MNVRGGCGKQSAGERGGFVAALVCRVIQCSWGTGRTAPARHQSGGDVVEGCAPRVVLTTHGVICTRVKFSFRPKLKTLPLSDCTAKDLSCWVSWNHRRFWVGGAFKDHPVQLFCHGQGRLPLEQVAPSPVRRIIEGFGLEGTFEGPWGGTSSTRSGSSKPHHRIMKGLGWKGPSKVHGEGRLLLGQVAPSTIHRIIEEIGWKDLQRSIGRDVFH